MNISQAIEHLYTLRVDTTSREGDGSPHEKPHKPLLLLAALDLIDADLATPCRIPWNQALRDRFTTLFKIVRKLNDRNSPQLPFRHLASDTIWQPVEADGTTPIRREIRVSDYGKIFARFSSGLEHLAASPAGREQIRAALIARYFPWATDALYKCISEPSKQPKAAAEDGNNSARSAAFRRKILEIYDHQCSACGLRIRLQLPDDREISFIDAAHLLPFVESHNDHPTNGLALCKNHHWALDRGIIAPTPDYRWNVSPRIEARRSNGEREISELAQKRLLLPKDRAFWPDSQGLQWRSERLLG